MLNAEAEHREDSKSIIAIACFIAIGKNQWFEIKKENQVAMTLALLMNPNYSLLSVNHSFVACEQSENACLLNVNMADFCDAALFGSLRDRCIANGHKTKHANCV